MMRAEEAEKKVQELRSDVSFFCFFCFAKDNIRAKCIYISQHHKDVFNGWYALRLKLSSTDNNSEYIMTVCHAL